LFLVRVHSEKLYGSEAKRAGVGTLVFPDTNCVRKGNRSGRLITALMTASFEEMSESHKEELSSARLPLIHPPLRIGSGRGSRGSHAPSAERPFIWGLRQSGQRGAWFFPSDPATKEKSAAKENAVGHQGKDSCAIINVMRAASVRGSSSLVCPT
jgi:hypothetical protein